MVLSFKTPKDFDLRFFQKSATTLSPLKLAQSHSRPHLMFSLGLHGAEKCIASPVSKMSPDSISARLGIKSYSAAK